MATTDSTSGGRLLSLPLGAAFLAEFCALTSFLLLVSAMPMLAVGAGASSSSAGLITGLLLLGTVGAEAAASAAIRRFGYRSVLAAGAILLGAPSLALLVHEPLPAIFAISLVRGLGFGLCGVVTGALTAELLPPEHRGEGLGLLGVVSGGPAILAVPAGIWLAGHDQFAAAAMAAAAVGLLPLTVLRWLPRGRGAEPSAMAPSATELAGETSAAEPLGEPSTGARRPSSRSTGAAFRLPLILAAATVSAGVLDSFLPIAKGIPSSLSSAALLVQAIVATVSRWQAGRFGDRHGHARLLLPALTAAAAGMLALVMLGSPAAIFAGMVLFGAGFGVLENTTFTLLTEQVSEVRASARWNFAYDAGYGAGPAIFGLVCLSIGYPAAFALAGVVILAALPAALRERLA